jgi:hypothetical protein
LEGLVCGDKYKNMLSTKRQIINDFRKMLQEQNADSNFSNQFLYNALMNQGKWLVKREISAGRIYRNNSLFQTLPCQEVIEVPTTEKCCPVKTNCIVYRTKYKLPEMWIDNLGPVVRSVNSVDNTTDFFYTDPITWQSRRNNPYHKMQPTKYSFPADGYLWFPEYNPGFVNIVGYFTDDIALLDVKPCSPAADCDDKKECVRFLDTQFMVPDWLHSEMMAKAFQLMFPTKQLPEDVQIDKNTNRKN